VLCIRFAIVIGIALFSGRPAVAQSSSSGTAEDQTSAKKDTEGWNVAWDNRPSLRYGDVLRVDLRARMVTDLRSSGALDARDETRFDIPRRRIGVSGVIADRAEFQVERELADGRAWRDVFVNYRQFDRLNVQGGQFKLPFGLDENTSSTNLDFVYRSRAAALSPGRDPGVMAHGRVRILRYAAGVFVRDGDNGRGDESLAAARSSTFAGRLLLQPLRSSSSVFEDFQAGVAFTTGDVASSIADLRGPSALGNAFARPEFGVQGTRRRTGLELRWRPGPFSVQSEWIRLTSERRGQRIDDSDLPALVAAAWYVQGTWVATGEKKADGADEPKRPLFDGGFGSLEFAARAESLRFSSGGTGMASLGPRAEVILPHRDRALALGVNWSPNRWVRVQANLVRYLMAAPSSSVWSRVVRIRFAM
jgi:phosphate-selective porin OprO/OprP